MGWPEAQDSQAANKPHSSPACRWKVLLQSVVAKCKPFHQNLFFFFFANGHQIRMMNMGLCSHVWKCFLFSSTCRQTLMDEATMNKQGYYHNPPQHRQRTKTVTHPCNLLRLTWFAFIIYFDFNFDHEQMGLPPPLTVSQFLRFAVTFFLLITHAQSTFTQQTKTIHTHTHTNKAEQVDRHFDIF